MDENPKYEKKRRYSRNFMRPYEFMDYGTMANLDNESLDRIFCVEPKYKKKKD